jgi:hypothetical protein
MRLDCESDSSPPHHISQLDPESSSMPVCVSGSDDSRFEDSDLARGNTDDLVSKLWWQDLDDSDKGSGDSGSEKQDEIPDSDLDSEGDEINLGELDPTVQDPNEGFFQLPESLKDLRKQLLGEYVLPTEPAQCTGIRTLTTSETISLQHYVAWRKSNGTLYSYKSFKYGGFEPTSSEEACTRSHRICASHGRYVSTELHCIYRSI